MKKGQGLSARFSDARLLMGMRAVPDEERFNVNGGAIAIGYPLGATGARTTTTLARELQRSNTRFGIVSAGIGKGQGIAILIENTQV